MNRANRILGSTGILVLAMIACNLPGQAPTPTQPSPGQVATDAAMTVAALALTGQSQVTQPPTVAPVLDTPTPSETPTATLSPTPTVPMVRVSENTNCRTGPGTVYDLIDALMVGQEAVVVGKYSAGNYWIINRLNGSGTCWLWGQYATVTGNTAGLPEYPVPPTPTPSLPAAPQNFNATISCTLSGAPFFVNKVTVNMSWVDAAHNETGYRIFRNGSLLVTLGENSTNHTDTTTLPAIWVLGDPPPSVTYAIEAFNATGKSGQKSETLICP